MVFDARDIDVDMSADVDVDVVNEGDIVHCLRALITAMTQSYHHWNFATQRSKPSSDHRQITADATQYLNNKPTHHTWRR